MAAQDPIKYPTDRPTEYVFIGEKAYGTITAAAANSITDGKVIVIGDGAVGHTPITFEFDKTGAVSGTNTPIVIVAGQTAADVAAAILTTINSVTTGLNVTAFAGPSSSVINVINDNVGEEGNITITTDSGLTVTGMSGGGTALSPLAPYVDDLVALTTSVSAFTQGSIPFASATKDLTEANATLFWNDTNKDLLLGGATTGATETLSILGSKTAVSAAGTAWKAVDLQASTLTLTGGVGVTAISEAYLAAPTITSTSVTTVAAASTLTIAGPPAAGGSVTITSPTALKVSGQVQFGVTNAVGYAPAALVIDAPIASLGLGKNLLVSDGSIAFGTIQSAISGKQWALGICGPPVSTLGTPVLSWTDTANIMIGTVTDADASKLQIQADKTVASGTSAVYNGIKFVASTLSLTGNTAVTTATGVNFHSVFNPTYLSDTATCAITHAATMFIGGAPIASTNVTIANTSALRINPTTNRTATASQIISAVRADPIFTLTGPGSGTAYKYGALIDLSGMNVTAGAGSTVLTTLKLVACTSASARNTNRALDITGNTIMTGVYDLTGAHIGAQGTSIASNPTIVLPTNGNVFELTGTTAVTLITTTGYKNGHTITLVANENVTVVNGTATSEADVTIRLAGSGDFSMSAEDSVTLCLCSTTAGGQAWRETARTVI